MKRMETGRWVIAALLLAAGGMMGRADGFALQTFCGTGGLSYNTLNNGTNYNYRIEWAPAPGGYWNEFGSAAVFWLDAKPQEAGVSVTNLVPMCYRVVATSGDYMAVDISGGTGAASYPVTYYRTLADVPGGANSDAYKTTNMLMRLIPKGRFPMGSPPDELGKETLEAPHPVILTHDFYVGVFEVTQRQWELVMGNKPSFFSNETYYQTRPVEQVSYYDIRENPAGIGSAISPNWPQSAQVHVNSFMGKLRTKTGIEGFDLPTEAQWEYACRAGTATALNSGYNLTSITNDFHMDVAGRYRFNGGSSGEGAPNGDTSVGTAKTGSYLPNAWGLYDMHGNVWEWCLDWAGGAYPAPWLDPMGATSGGTRVLRGGGWGHGALYCRSAQRFDRNPVRTPAFGFRACCVPAGQ